MNRSQFSVLGMGVHLLGAHQPLRPNGAVGETIHAGHLADLAVPDPVAHLAHAVARRTLVAHLRRHAVLVGELGQQARLVYAVRQRFFAIDVFAHRDRIRCHEAVGMVGGAHDNRVDGIAHLVEHRPVVPETARIGIAVEGLFRIIPVGIAQCDDILALAALEHAGPAAADAHARDVEFVTGSGMSVRFSEHYVGHHRRGGQPRSRLCAGNRVLKFCLP